MSNAIIKQNIVKVPKRTNTNFQKLNKVITRLKLLGKDFNLEKIALAIGISKGEFQNLLKIPKIISLNTFLRSTEKEVKTSEDVIPSRILTPEQEAVENEKKEIIKQALKKLKRREQQVLEMNFGLGGKEITLEEIGNHFGFTRTRVGQIKKEALIKLRKERELEMLR